MPNFVPKIRLRCPNCGQRGHITTLTRSEGKRKCRNCGHIGDPKTFEEKVKPKPKKKK